MSQTVKVLIGDFTADFKALEFTQNKTLVSYDTWYYIDPVLDPNNQLLYFKRIIPFFNNGGIFVIVDGEYKRQPNGIFKKMV